MPSFPDSIFLFVLALLLFGPKRLPVLARELGKWVGEFRRASNEFKMQMEDELRISEQAEREKKIAAMEAAAPVAPPVSEAEQGRLDAPVEQEPLAVNDVETPVDAVPEIDARAMAVVEPVAETTVTDAATVAVSKTGGEAVDGVRTPLPIAVSGDLKIMPPATGLPVAQQRAGSAVVHSGGNGSFGSSMGGLLDAIPAKSEMDDAAAETAHGN
jgi:sec-independent protein translocase protein TatB